MYSISICFGPTGTIWSLLFRTQESAEKVHECILAAIAEGGIIVSCADDFGQSFASPTAKIHGVVFEDMNRSKLAHQERMLHDARTKAGAQKTAQSDPQLRQAMQPAGPGIVSPFLPNGGMR